MGVTGLKRGLSLPLQLYLTDNQQSYFSKGVCSALLWHIAHVKVSYELCSLFFKTRTRVNPETGKLSTYYRFVESYCNVLGKSPPTHHFICKFYWWYSRWGSVEHRWGVECPFVRWKAAVCIYGESTTFCRYLSIRAQKKCYRKL